MRRLIRTLAVATVFSAGPALAENWGSVMPMVTEALAEGQMTIGDPYWFPNAATPETATHAIGVVLVEIGGAAGNFNVATGVFVRKGKDWKLLKPVPDLFGSDPRDPRWEADKVTLTTTMPKPGDPRCCPTGEARWSIDLKTGAVTELD